MAFALDMAVVFIMISTSIVGYCRGFYKYAIKLLGTIACVIIAMIASELLAPTVYEKLVEPRLRADIQQQLKSFDVVDAVKESLLQQGYDVEIPDEQLKAALSDSGDISASVAKAARDYGLDKDSAQELEGEMDTLMSGDFAEKVGSKMGFDSQNIKLAQESVCDMIRAFASGDEVAGADYVTDTVLKPLAVVVVRYVLFIIILIVAESIMAIIFAIAGVFDNLPKMSGVNRFFGLVAGMVKGVMYLALIGFVVATVIKTTGGTEKFNTQLIDKTYMFRYIFYFFYKL